MASSSLVCLSVPAGPLGVEFEPDFSGSIAIVGRFVELPLDGARGVIEADGRIGVGDVLVGLDGRDLTRRGELSFDEIMRLLDASSSQRQRQICFQNSRAFYRNQRAAQKTKEGLDMERQSGIKASVVESRVLRSEDGKALYTQYLVKVAWRHHPVLATTPSGSTAALTAQSNSTSKATTNWEVWKRYSEFVSLDATLQEKYGWRLASAILPPKKIFNMSPSLIEERMNGLDKYLQSVLAVEGICEFDKHFGSKDLQTFLEADGRHLSSSQSQGSATKQGGEASISTTLSSTSSWIEEKQQNRPYCPRLRIQRTPRELVLFGAPSSSKRSYQSSQDRPTEKVSLLPKVELPLPLPPVEAKSMISTPIPAFILPMPVQVTQIRQDPMPAPAPAPVSEPGRPSAAPPTANQALLEQIRARRRN